MKPPRRLVPWLIAVVLLLGASAAIYARIRHEGTETLSADGTAARGSDTTSSSADAAFSTDVPIPVRGAEVIRDTLVMLVSAAGQAEAWQRTVLSAQVEGRVAALGARESQAVAAGAPLVALDPAQYGLSVREAEAELRRAQATYQETTLFDDRIPDEATRRARQEAARARSGLDGAQVRLEKARLDLARTRVSAPWAGRIATVRVVPGQWVRAGDELMTIVDLDPIKVEVQVLESQVGFLTPGRGARVSFAAFPGEAFTGRVESINPVVDGNTRTARVTVLVSNPGGRVLPGMYARVALDARRFPDRTLVPRSAILERDNRRTMLFVFEGEESRGVAKWRYVTTGLQNDSLVEILADVETDSVRAGERVLVDGHHSLIHDARVRLVEDVEAAGGRP